MNKLWYNSNIKPSMAQSPFWNSPVWLHRGKLILRRLRTGYTQMRALLSHLAMTWPTCVNLWSSDAVGYSASALYMCTCDSLSKQTCGGVLIWMEISISKSYFIIVYERILASEIGLYFLFVNLDFTSVQKMMLGKTLPRAKSSAAISRCWSAYWPLASKERLIKGRLLWLLSEHQINSCTLNFSLRRVGGEGWGGGRASLPSLIYLRKWTSLMKE